MVNLGERLKTLRIESGLTQKQIAERVGVAISGISSYESGTRLPSYPVLIKLARVYHVQTDFLLGVTSKETIDISDLTDDDRMVIKATVSALREKYR